MSTDLHIGKIIKERAEDLGIGPTKLAALVNTSKQNVYGIFKRSSVDSELLHSICIALRHDFFRYYTGLKDHSKEDIPYDNSALITLRKMKDELSQTKHQLKDAQEKIDMLKQINGLLEEKMGN